MRFESKSFETRSMEELEVAENSVENSPLQLSKSTFKNPCLTSVRWRGVACAPLASSLFPSQGWRGGRPASLHWNCLRLGEWEERQSRTYLARPTQPHLRSNITSSPSLGTSCCFPFSIDVARVLVYECARRNKTNCRLSFRLRNPTARPYINIGIAQAPPTARTFPIATPPASSIRNPNLRVVLLYTTSRLP